MRILPHGAPCCEPLLNELWMSVKSFNNYTALGIFDIWFNFTNHLAYYLAIDGHFY